MDIAMVQDPATGKLTFAKNAAGDFYLDDKAVYPVIATLFAERGRYLADPTVGTYLSTIRQSGKTTATRLNSAVSDALEQVRRDGLIVSGQPPQSNRLPSGPWLIPLGWQTFSGNAYVKLTV